MDFSKSSKTIFSRIVSLQGGFMPATIPPYRLFVRWFHARDMNKISDHRLPPSQLIISGKPSPPFSLSFIRSLADTGVLHLVDRSAFVKFDAELQSNFAKTALLKAEQGSANPLNSLPIKPNRQSLNPYISDPVA
ncbi:hypothetical protein Pfo_021285 [Paulownia fortunei]|nr:hypothetical protein Pfo_021285 [Paulownia fortunei]